jgi:hypothetical protein
MKARKLCSLGVDARCMGRNGWSLRSRPRHLAPPPCPLDPHTQATQNTPHAARHLSHAGRNSGQTQPHPHGTTTHKLLPALNAHGTNASTSLQRSCCRAQRPSASLPALNAHGTSTSAALPALNAHGTSASASLPMPISPSTSASTPLRASLCRAQRPHLPSCAVSSSRSASQG